MFLETNAAATARSDTPAIASRVFFNDYAEFCALLCGPCGASRGSKAAFEEVETTANVGLQGELA